jgi:hypothetical protein
MPKPTKPTRRPKAELSTASSKAKAYAPKGEPFLRFYHPLALRKKTLVVLEAVEAAPDPKQHRKALADLVVDLTRCGMDTYFMTPLKRAKAGFITEQSAGLGMAGAVQVLSSVIRSIIGGMGAPQLLSVCGSVRSFMQ